MKVLYIIAQKDFRDEELKYPKEILENAGYKVVVASITTDIAKGAYGMTIKPDIAVKDANVDDYALIAMAGGSGAPTLMNYPEVMDLLKEAKAKNKKMAAICVAPMIFAKAGVLEGKNATVFKTDETLAALKEGGARYTGEEVTVDGNLVTGNGPGAAKKFGQELVKLLKR